MRVEAGLEDRALGERRSEPPSDGSDLDALVSEARRNVPGAAERLWSSLARRLVRAAIALGVPVEEAEDVVQDSLLYAFRNFDRYDRCRAPFSVWTHRILVGRTSNWHRARRRLSSALARLAGHPRPPLATPPDEAMAAEEAKRTLLNLAARLSPARRRIWALTQVSGMSAREAAATLGIREETVRSHLRHARLALERAIEETR